MQRAKAMDIEMSAKREGEVMGYKRESTVYSRQFTVSEEEQNEERT